MAFVSRETRRAETKAFVKDFFKSAALGLVIIFLAIGILIASNIVSQQWDKTLAAKSADVNHLSGQVKQSVLKLDQVQTESRNLYLGVDLDRKAKDDVIAEEIFKRGLTWTGKEEGQRVGIDFGQRYPDVPRAFYKEVFGIERWNEFERAKQVACAYKGFKSYVSSVSRGKYSYMAIVNFSQVLSDGTRKQKYFLSQYSLKEDGTFSGFTYDEVIK